MKTFKDDLGRPWPLAVTVGSLRRVREATGLDLTQLSAGTPPLGVRLTTEPILVGEVLQAALAPELAAKNVSPDSLLDALAGDGLAGGFAALAEELCDFFRKSGRTEQATFLTAQMHLLTAGAAKLKAKVESLDLDEMLDREVEGAFSKFATSSPASSASTPTA